MTVVSYGESEPCACVCVCVCIHTHTHTNTERALPRPEPLKCLFAPRLLSYMSYNFFFCSAPGSHLSYFLCLMFFYFAVPLESPILIEAGGTVGVCLFTSSWRGVVLRAKLGEVCF